MNEKWKWVFRASMALNVILAYFLIGLPEREKPIPQNQVAIPGTKQELDKFIDIEVGTSAKELISVVGRPIKRDAVGSTEEWFYCRTGGVVDEFVQVSLVDKKVVRINNYNISSIDAEKLSGSCELFFKVRPNTPR